jgi:hypothetical protein
MEAIGIRAAAPSIPVCPARQAARARSVIIVDVILGCKDFTFGALS